MRISRRRLFQSVVLTAGTSSAAAGAETGVNVDILRAVSAVHGTGLSDQRLRALQPVMEHRLLQLRALREFEMDEAVAPTWGILEK